MGKSSTYRKTTPVDEQRSMQSSLLDEMESQQRENLAKWKKAKVPWWRIGCSVTLCAPAIIAVALILLSFAIWGSMFYVSNRMSSILVNDLNQQNSEKIVRQLNKTFNSVQDTSVMLEKLAFVNLLPMGATHETLSKNRGSLFATGAAFYKQLASSFVYFGTPSDTFGSVSISDTTCQFSYLYDGHNFRHPLDRYNGSVVGPITNTSSTYKPSMRPWYIDAVNAGKLIWTDYYVFSGVSGEIGITTAAPIYNQTTNTLKGVVAVDYTLTDLNEFMSTLKIAKTGAAVVLDENGLLVAASTGSVANTTSSTRLKAIEAPEPSIRDAAIAVNKHFGNYDAAIARAKQSNVTFFANINGNHSVISVLYYAHPSWKEKTSHIILSFFPLSDYTKEVDESLLISGIVIVLIALSITFVAILAVILIITIPLLRIARKMNSVSDMDLKTIKSSRNIFYELALISSAFYMMVDKLQEYRSYIPEELLIQVEMSKKGIDISRPDADEESDPESSHHERGSSVRDSLERESVVSGRSGFSAGSHSSQLSRHRHAVNRMNILSIGMQRVNCSLIQIRLVGIDDMLEQGNRIHTYVNQYGRILNIIRTNCPSAIISEFTEDRIYVTFNVSGRYIKNHQVLAVRYAAILKQKLAEEKLSFVYHLAVHYGPILTGNLGNANMRARRITGMTKKFTDTLIEVAQRANVPAVVSNSLLRLSQLKSNDDQPVTKLIDIIHFHKAIDGNERVNKNIVLQPVHELIEMVRVQGDEWIYELDQQSRISQFQLFNHAIQQLLTSPSDESSYADVLTTVIGELETYISKDDVDDPRAVELRDILEKALDEGYDLYNHDHKDPGETFFTLPNAYGLKP